MEIKLLKDKTGNGFYPETHIEAVYDNEGLSLQYLLSNKLNSLVSGYNIKKIYNQSVLGNGNLEIGFPILNHSTNDLTYELSPNVLHLWDEIPSLTLTLLDPENTNMLNIYMFVFKSGNTPTTLTLPNTLFWQSGFENWIPLENSIYEITIINNIVRIVEGKQRSN